MLIYAYACICIYIYMCVYVCMFYKREYLQDFGLKIQSP